MTASLPRVVEFQFCTMRTSRGGHTSWPTGRARPFVSSTIAGPCADEVPSPSTKTFNSSNRLGCGGVRIAATNSPSPVHLLNGGGVLPEERGEAQQKGVVALDDHNIYLFDDAGCWIPIYLEQGIF